MGPKVVDLPPVAEDGPANAPETDDFNWYALEPKRELTWVPCYSGQKCARLLRPFDYDTPDGPTTAIAIRMIPATDKENYRGTIFLNPGGPGGSGTEFVGRAGKNIANVVGPSFDLLGFDPRGTGMTTPLAWCFNTDSERAIWNTQEGHQLLNASDDSVGVFHARTKLLGQRCEKRIGGEWGIGRFVSTPNVARDMLEISQMLGQDQLQYWGFSYGSVLGQYFAAIYPDKVKRLIVDGVYDAENYKAALWNTNIVDVDRVVDALFDFCHQAGPSKCALYDSSPEKIRQRFFRVLEDVKTNPVSVPLAEPPLVITHKALLSQFFYATYKPLTMYGSVVDTIHAIETNNASALTALAPLVVSPVECKCNERPDPALRADNEATFSIACGDGDKRPWDLAEYTKWYQGLESQSPLMAPMWGIYWMQCAEWPVRAKWRWTGPLAAKNTSHPILVVSAKYDPVTPLPDARAVQKRYGGAGLLVQDSYGHCSLSSPSLCTAKHVRRYFEEGTLPEEGTICDADELPLVGKRDTKGLHALRSEDALLLEASRGLAEDLPVYRRGL
ncbi:alpha/beta-hydrolase [Lentinus tigrinus ALCF2SS1-7]|uniref:Alpha/beta-hydrolase n=1 Tax=Lentinus tigrinus ALCF2SS1-6 TaxID=1328759 RepID=A0A5C2RVU1_9APHY|nr:alpha/beta-hydrolase [Lentinus tigrinus ALCF2SS1-6]RPD76755.1 alpha/beta-hydrolase [Lentinus tigrinus ALCF2SS1-7]